MRVPWTARRSKQSILKEINLEYSLEKGFPGGSDSKESACSAGDLGLIPELERSPGEGRGYPLWYSILENSRDCIVHRVAKSQTLLSDFHFLFVVL